MSSVEITDQNIKSFEPVTRKWGIDFALYRDNSASPPKWTTLFTLKMTADKPSVLNVLRKMKELVKNQIVDRTKHVS